MTEFELMTSNVMKPQLHFVRPHCQQCIRLEVFFIKKRKLILDGNYIDISID